MTAIRNQIIAHGRTLVLLAAMAGAGQAMIFASPALAIQEDQFPTCRVALEGTGFSQLMDTREYNGQCCFVMSEKRWYNDNAVFLSTVYSVNDEESVLTTHCRRAPVIMQSLVSGGGGDGGGGGSHDDDDDDDDGGTPPPTTEPSDDLPVLY